MDYVYSILYMVLRLLNTGLLSDLLCENCSKFKNFTYLSEADFTFVLDGIWDAILKIDTTFQGGNFLPKIRKLL